MIGNTPRRSLLIAITLLSTLAVPKLGRAQAVSFIARRDFLPQLANSRAVAVGDFNGDGRLDLAIVNVTEGFGYISVLLGNGDGTFQAAVNYTIGNNHPGFVAVGDFNGDGKLDLAVSNSDPDNLLILLGNGDGTFQEAVSYNAGICPGSLVVGDFNGDGKLDLAVANSARLADPGGISVLLGNGDGTFQAAVHYTTGSDPRSVAVGDFNGDGKLDLAVGYFTDPNVSVLLGNGDGTFQAAQNFPVIYSDSVAVGDFNGDGKADLVVADGSVLLGNGDGTFQSAQRYSFGGGSVTVGDFNGDGKLDVVFSDTSNGTVSVQLGNGDGTLQTAKTFATGLSVLDATVAVGDFNGDGKLDVVTPSASVLLGNGDGTFLEAPTYAVGVGPNFVAGSDLNRDGVSDLVMTNLKGVSVLLGSGDGTFQAAQEYAAGTAPISVAVADVNGDGIPDLIVANHGNPFRNDRGGISVLLGNGDGTFQAARNFAAGTEPQSMAVGDLNGDGMLDLVLIDRGCLAFDSCSPTISVLLGNGDGTFQAAVNYEYTAGKSPWYGALGDFNGDGKLDLVVANNGSDNVSVLLGNGDGSFQGPQNFHSGINTSSVAIGDFNGDGDLDLAVATAGSGFVPAVAVLLGNGDGTFQAARSFADSSDSLVVVGDFNGDGKLDLALPNSSGVSILVGNGDGTFQPELLFGSGEGGGGAAAVGDFNGDGKPDLAVAGCFSARVCGVSVLINDTPRATSVAVLSSVNPSVFGQLVTLRAIVNPASGSETPTGTIVFQDGATTLGTVSLDSSGSVALTVSSFAVGTHQITATYSGDSGFLASHGSVTQNVSYAICPLYDQTRAVKSGATFPIQLYLCDASGNDVSSTAVALQAIQITSTSGYSGGAASPGNANPGGNFRFDTTLGPAGGYVFNLDTGGLAPGTYSLQFTAGGDPLSHAVNFAVR